MLVLYYSYSNGNTERIARKLSEKTQSEMERIELVQQYTGSYDSVVEQGKREVEEGYTPRIRNLSHDISDYDVIAIGTPTWWYSMAPAILTLLKENDFHGKTLIPFMTNAGWPGHVIRDMERTQPNSKFILPLKVTFDSDGGDRMITEEDEIDDWIEKIKNHLSKEEL